MYGFRQVLIIFSKNLEKSFTPVLTCPCPAALSSRTENSSVPSPMSLFRTARKGMGFLLRICSGIESGQEDYGRNETRRGACSASRLVPDVRFVSGESRTSGEREAVARCCPGEGRGSKENERGSELAHGLVFGMRFVFGESRTSLTNPGTLNNYFRFTS